MQAIDDDVRSEAQPRLRACVPQGLARLARQRPRHACMVLPVAQVFAQVADRAPIGGRVERINPIQAEQPSTRDLGVRLIGGGAVSLYFHLLPTSNKPT